MIKHVFFDLDGTVTDTFAGVSNAVVYALNKSGAPVPEREALRPFLGPPLMYSFTNYCGMSGPEAERAVAFYREYYTDRGIFELKVYDGIVDVFDELRSAGKKLYLATSKPEPFAMRIVDRFGLTGHLDGIAGASFDSSRAEKDQVIDYALSHFGADPAQSVMVGDRKFDIEGAKRFGMASVGVLYGYGPREELEAAGADAIVSVPGDIPTEIYKM